MVLFVWLLPGTAECFAQKVIRFADVQTETSIALDDRIAWARTEARSRNLTSFRFGFAFVRKAPENSRVGRYWSRSGGATLAELIDPQAAAQLTTVSVGEAARNELRKLERPTTEQRVVERPIAVIVRVTTDKLNFYEIDVSDLDSQVWFEDDWFFWCGQVSGAEAIAFATELYQSGVSPSLREDAISVLGVADPSDKTSVILNNVLAVDDDGDVREQALFWIGTHGTDAAYATVKHAISNDKSADVREHAVFVLNRFDRTVVYDDLIEIAKTSGDSDVADQARFWLGQRIADRLVGDKERDKEMDTDDARVKRQALYALFGNEEDADSVEALKEIAANGPSPSLRREAIQMLGRIEHPNALSALVSLYK